MGELDLATTGPLRDLLLELEAGRLRCLALDLRRLSFMDCSGLGVVLDAGSRARRADRGLQVICVPGQVMRLLTLSGADQQVDLVARLSWSPSSRGAPAGHVDGRQLGYRARGLTAVITLPDHVERDGILTLRSRSERALGAGSRAIAIDMRAVRSIDTQALSELGIALRTIKRHDAQVALVGADPRVRWALELCDIDGLAFHPTMRRALASVRERPRSIITPFWRSIVRRRDSAPDRSSPRGDR